MGEGLRRGASCLTVDAVVVRGVLFEEVGDEVGDVVEGEGDFGVGADLAGWKSGLGRSLSKGA